MAIFDVPKRFSRQWVQRKVPQMDSTEFHAMFHEAATRGWDEDELRATGSDVGGRERLRGTQGRLWLAGLGLNSDVTGAALP